ncbi:MAG: hypothetical protein HFI33_12910 [Lachnospiraceae bacterium]|nr:hypothetical protein [Lachnospiraceae bacterium]
MNQRTKEQTEKGLLVGRERELSDIQLAALIAQVEQEGMLRAPVGMKQEILEKTRRADVQLVIRTQDMSKGLQVFFYGLKISMAAAMAMFILFWMPQDYSVPDMSQPPIIEMDWDEGPQKTLAQQMDEKANQIGQELSRVTRQWVRDFQERDLSKDYE